MLNAMHLDALILLLASLYLVALGQGYYCWIHRIPVFVLAFFDFTISLNLFGLSIPRIPVDWFWLRVCADLSTLMIVSVRLAERHGHRREFIE